MKSTHKTTCLMLLIFALASATSFPGCITDDGETEIIPKTLEQYKQEMTSFIAAEKAVVENCVVGYNKGDFKTAATFESTRDNYLLALTAAEAVLKKENVTIPEIVAANKTLASPGKAFTGSLWISDRRPLNDAIVAAEALNTATPEGTQKGEAPAQAKTTFTDAITAAKAVRGASATIDRQVTEAITKLEEAKQNFLKAIIK